MVSVPRALYVSQVVEYKQGYKTFSMSVEAERMALQERHTNMLRRTDTGSIRSFAPTKVYRTSTAAHLERLDNSVRSYSADELSIYCLAGEIVKMT